MVDAETRHRIGRFWDAVSAEGAPRPTRWWMVPEVVRWYNQRAGGVAEDGVGAGLTRRALAALAARGVATPLERGVSVGGGSGAKERGLLKADLVRRIDVFELSATRIAQGRAAAEAEGLAERIRFIREDPFVGPRSSTYDLVYWNNALHHMFDVDDAVAWSRAVLRRGGAFLMDDFVAPDRFQFSSAALAAATAVRIELPERLLRHPADPSRRLPVEVRNVNPDALAEADPSEAVQSSLILGAVQTYFPDADILPMGGVIYNLALKDTFANFDPSDPADAARLETLLALDAVLTQRPDIETQYAIAIAFRTGRLDPARILRWRARLALRRAAPSRTQLRGAFRRLVPAPAARRWLGRARRRLVGR